MLKLRPVDFGAEGVYLCGRHYPKHIAEALSQAYGAAGRALTLLSHDTVTASVAVAKSMRAGVWPAGPVSRCAPTAPSIFTGRPGAGELW